MQCTTKKEERVRAREEVERGEWGGCSNCRYICNTLCGYAFTHACPPGDYVMSRRRWPCTKVLQKYLYIMHASEIANPLAPPPPPSLSLPSCCSCCRQHSSCVGRFICTTLLSSSLEGPCQWNIDPFKGPRRVAYAKKAYNLPRLVSRESPGTCLPWVSSWFVNRTRINLWACPLVSFYWEIVCNSKSRLNLFRCPLARQTNILCGSFKAEKVLMWAKP